MDSRTWSLILIALAGRNLAAQPFNSGSTGVDGALILTTPGTIEFDPKAMNLDRDGDGVFHFTTIEIGVGVHVKFTARRLNGPVYFLATGPVQVNGVLDLGGGDGCQNVYPAERIHSIPGPGGFSGGLGRYRSSHATLGFGPGGGLKVGASAGHLSKGRSAIEGNAGLAYGNDFLVPLIGKSGGSGSDGDMVSGLSGGGGGGGGGALLIASNSSISIDGSIRANGGTGAASSGSAGEGGGGSGGAIRLVAPSISGRGSITATGGGRDLSSRASDGRIRMEAFEHGFTGSTKPDAPKSFPYDLRMPGGDRPAIRVVSVGGVPATTTSNGEFTVPDVWLHQSGSVAVVIEAGQVPLSAVVEVLLTFEDNTDATIRAPQLNGTLASSTATVMVAFPHGFSSAIVRAVW